MANASRIGELGVIDGTYWSVDPDDPNPDWRGKKWVIKVRAEDSSYKYDENGPSYDVVFFETVEGVNGETALEEDQDIIDGQVLKVGYWKKCAKAYEEHVAEKEALAKAKTIVETAGGESSSEEDDDADEAGRAPGPAPGVPKKRRREEPKKVVTSSPAWNLYFNVTRSQRRRVDAVDAVDGCDEDHPETLLFCRSSTFFVAVGGRISAEGKMDKQEYKSLLDGKTGIFEYTKPGKRFSSSTKRSDYLRKHHKHVYAKYIEPHASTKRINGLGDLVKRYAFKEAFPVHMRHALVICRDKRALAYGSTEAFSDFLLTLDERYKTADVKTLRRIIFALRNVLRGKVKDLVLDMQDTRGKKWASGSLDFWSSRGGCDSFGGLLLHYVAGLTKLERKQKRQERVTVAADADMVREAERLRKEALAGVEEVEEKTLVRRKVLISFRAFDKVSHTGINIRKWVERELEVFGLDVQDFMLMVPDSASNGADSASGINFKVTRSSRRRLHEDVPASTKPSS